MFLKINLNIEVELIYVTMLTSGVQQGDSLYRYNCILTYIF